MTTSHSSTFEAIVITRVYRARRDAVWRAWTDPERLKRWWAPAGFTTPFCTVDLRLGGVFHYCMRSPAGQDLWGKGVYREVTVPERLVFIDSFSDTEGNAVPPEHYGMSPQHPFETLVTVTFAEHTDGTELTLRHEFLASVPERGGAEAGWSEMLERLAEDLIGERSTG